jgi:predicted transcriptional regulator
MALVGDIIAAYVSNNSVPASELPVLIADVYSAITNLSGGASGVAFEPEVEKPSPAEIRRSVRPDGIISFIDGRTYKTLKRHLTVRGLTPEAYRSRYGLPSSYPMVAPSYSKRRSSIARAFGLGVPGARATLGAMAEREEEAGNRPKSLRKA